MKGLYLRWGDCLSVLSHMPEASVGAVVCDPPYEISFMGRGWDGTGIAYSPELWSGLYRALKPGAQVKAFSATRTYHRMAAAMRDAGFVDLALEAWTYGSGFPKSMNIGMAIDKADRGHPQGSSDPMKRGGSHRPDRHALDKGGATGKAPTGLMSDYGDRVLAAGAAKHWEGWGTALKPAWEPVIIGRKPE